MTYAFGPPVRRALVAAIFLGIVAVIGAVRFDTFFRAPILEEGDVAVNSIQIDYAKHFSELYGNYSRFEFNHPGPAFFYVYAGFEWILHDLLGVSPSPHNAQLFACLCLQAFFFSLALGLLHAHLPRRALLALGLLAAAVLFGRLQDPFVSIWPPHVLLMPFFCFLVAATSVATGRLDHLPWAMLVAGFLFHGHVAQPLFVVILGGLALGLGLPRAKAQWAISWREFARQCRGLFTGTAAIGALFLVPPVIDVLTRGARSNIAAIVGRFMANTEKGNSAFQSFLYFLSFATPARDQETIFTTLGPQTTEFFRAHWLSVAAWLIVFIGPSLLVLTGRHRLPPDQRRFFVAAGAMLAASVGGCVLWGMVQAGGMYHFNGYFYYGIYYFAGLLALALLPPMFDRFSPAPVCAVVCAASVAVAASAYRTSDFLGNQRGLPLQRGILAALRADPGPSPKILVFEHADWPIAASVALELRRRGVPFAVEPWWTFMFQPRQSTSRLGEYPERHASIWWITRNDPEGAPLKDTLRIHTRPAPLSPMGGEIRFVEHENGIRYVISGFGSSFIDQIITTRERAVLRFAPQHAENDVRILFDAASFNAGDKERPADVVFNGRPVGRLVATSTRTELAIAVPAAIWNAQPVATLELRFPNPVWHHVRTRPDYEWCWNWAIWRIRCELAPAKST